MSLFDLYKGLSSLSPEQRSLFSRRLAESGLSQQSGQLAPRPPGSDPVPASLTQQRLWLVEQMDPGDPFYNLPLFAFEILGPLDVGALGRTLAEIERRHEGLRTTFADLDGAPVQVVAPPGVSYGVLMPIIDLSGLPEELRAPTRERFTFEESRYPFDLARGPLWRNHLLRIGPEENLLCIVKHHIVSDAWSVAVFYKELSKLYAAFSLGLPSPLPDLPVQYPDYALWQRQRIAPRLPEDLAFWREMLTGAPELIELPFDHPRPPIRTYRGRRQEPGFPPELPDALHALAMRSGASLFILLLAAYDSVLHRYSGQDEIVLGSPVAGRNEVETELMIGFFVNTVVYRIDVGGNPTFRQLLSRTRDVVLDVYEHQEVPFDKVVEELQPKRNPAYGTIFQAMFSLQNVRTPDVTFAGLQVNQTWRDNETAQTDLITFGGTHESRLSVLQIEYNTDLFEDATITRLGGHLVNLLVAAAADPERPLFALPLLSAAERHQLAEWEAASAPRLTGAGPEDRLERRFAARAALAPDAPAVVFLGERLTYGELDRRANQLAQRLRGAGAGPGSRVGLCVERSADLIVAILGILKAGGAYVPLDPDHPAERLRFLVGDAGISVLVTQEALLSRVPAPPHVVLLDAERAALAGESTEAPYGVGDATGLAYVIYTSGSTGTPKGALISHENVVRLFPAMGTPFRFAPDQVWTMFHSYAFDFSVWEIWGALLHGGSVVVVPQAATRSPEAFLALLASERVTVLSQTPSAFRQLVGAVVEAENPPELALETVVVAAEVLVPQTLTAWLERGLPGRLINAYGITETTVFVTHRPIDPDDVAGSCLRIGGPIADLTLHVVDGYGETLPLGIAGELLIGGPGLGFGYLNRPDLTASRFVPDPFSSRPGERLYRSGDLTRRMADGGLEYLGRIDHQVKIRGRRIELGEIEVALAHHPAVRAATVMVRPIAHEEAALVAYYAATLDATRQLPTTAELRDFLKATLPSYMVPALFVHLPFLPINTNGKVDRAALPSPERQMDTAADVAPRTPIERLLAEIWQELLGLASVSVQDDFFELGGHSLLATRLISRLRHRLGIELSARVVFFSPKLEAMATEIEAIQVAQEGKEAAAGIPRHPRDRPLPLSFAQERLWLLDRLYPGSLYNVPLSLRLRGPLDAAAWPRGVSALRDRHESLRTRFPIVDGSPVQEIEAPESAEPWSTPLLDLAALPEAARTAEAERVASLVGLQAFDLAAGPVMRTALLRLATEEHLALFSIHHVATDGWSTGILLSEIFRLYRAASSGAPADLPDLPVQVADFAAWQRARLTDQALAPQLDYWRRQLAGAAVLDLPTDRPRPAHENPRGALAPFALDAPLSQALADLSRATGTTLYMTVLAGFAALLGRLSGRREVVLGSVVSGRGRREIEGLIGFFPNTLVLRTDLQGDATVTDLLLHVRAVSLGAFAHQDLPFEKLVHGLHPDRRAGQNPFFGVAFALHQALQDEATGTGLAIDIESVHSGAAKFDLYLEMVSGAAGLAGSFEYRTALFDATTIARWTRHFAALLAGLAEHPGERIDELPLLTPAEAQQLGREWNDTAAAFPRDLTLPELFARQAARRPDAVALVHGGRTLTYGELAVRARNLAVRLRRLGVRAEEPVALALGRSFDLIVAILGVLEAGGAYLPLDLSYPRERLAFLLADSQAGLLLTDRSHRERVERLAAEGVAVVCLDEPEEAQETARPAEPPRGVACADALAYVMYTSGSTGVPKGVAVTHRNVARLVLETGFARFGTDEVFLQLAPVSFDASTLEIWGPLLNGGRLVLFPGEHAALAEIGEAIRDHGVTTLWLTAGLFHQMVEHQLPLLSPLRQLLAGGDVLSPARVREALAALPGTAIVNGYGPTEGTTFSCCHTMIEPAGVGEPVPIGRPIASGRAVVLGRGQEPLPIGFVGELHVGGDGVARGYLHRPELTAERFVPDPSPDRPGERLYRTGDRVRSLADGRIEFLGRLDRQVKIRGFRIEPGEIEAVLALHPAVREAVVVVREESGSATAGGRLVAYFAARAEEPEAAALRDHLLARLPEHMVPTAFVPLAALPLTPQGKVDRAALPAPTPPRPTAQALPESDGERLLARLWREVLGLEAVGIDDNFFDLGGHSLALAAVHDRLSRELGIRVPLVELFENTNIRKLASRLAGGTAEAKGPDVAKAGQQRGATAWKERAKQARQGLRD